MANIPNIKYDFFIAHAGPSTEQAKELYDLLTKTYRVFLDAVSLVPGEKWSSELTEAQAASAITIALICNDFQAAYYAQEEVAAGISFERNWGQHRHLVVPVYLDGFPIDPTKIPYGLRCRHAIDVPKVGWVKPTADQLITVSSNQAQQQTIKTTEHPLHTYPCGPMVEHSLVTKALIQEYARLIYPYEALKVIDEAGELRKSAGPCDPAGNVTIVQRYHLPPPSNVSPIEFWLHAFTEACKQGPRMLAALLLVVPDDMFQETSKSNRKKLLESTLLATQI